MSSGFCNKAGQHRRDRSIGSMVRDREEELALFQSMRIRDQNYFLHPSSDDVEASLSEKSGSMSECNSLIPSTPARKIVNDLLTSELGKHDYDWLLTPPGTPLFPYLDHEKSNATRFHQNLPSLSGSSTKAYRGQQLATGLSHSSSKVVRSIASPRQPSSPSHLSMMNGTSAMRSSFTPTTTMSPCSRPSTPSKRVSAPTPARPSTPTTRPSSPMRRPLAPTSRPSSPMKRPLAPTSRPSTPTTRPSTPTATSARPLTPTGRPSTPTARPLTPTARPSTTMTRPSTPTGRPSIPITRASTPSGRSSTSTARPASPTTRSSTQTARPTMATTRRTPTSTIGSFSNANQSPYPLNGNANVRPNSPSRRIQTPLSSMPEVSSDPPPPNLRTTLPQRSRSATRGTSLGSRPGGNGLTYKSDTKDVISRSGRRAISPSPSRSSSRAISPSPSRSSSFSASHDHDPCSSHSSKDSAISPFIEKTSTARLMSTRSKIYSDSAVNRLGRASEDTPISRISSSSKKPGRPSATKETSFFGGNISKKPTDPTVRQMDVRRSPPSGFRPLLSNAHISSFYTRTSSLLRPPGNSTANLLKSSASGFGSENVKIVDCEEKVSDLLKDLDKGNSITQITIRDEENDSICSEAQMPNEVDREAELNHLESKEVGNSHCQESPQACKKDASILQLREAFQGKGTIGHDAWQHSTQTIEHSGDNELRVDTWQSDGFHGHLESTALNVTCCNMLQHRNDDLLLDISKCQGSELECGDILSNLESSIDTSCNESSKLDELSNCSEKCQFQKPTLALLESRLRQDLALELMLTFSDQSEGNHQHVNSHQ